MTEVESIFLNGFKIPANAKVVIGLPSVGNVGQLAVDCILCTLNQTNKLRYVGCLESLYVLPMTGYEKIGTTDSKLCMPIEVYEVLNQNLFIIQQRSLCLKGQQQLFSQSLLQWLQSIQFDSAVILTGASTEEVELQNSAKDSFLSSLLENAVHIPTPASRTSVGSSIPADDVDIDDMMNMTVFNNRGGYESSLPLGMTTAKYLVEASVASCVSSKLVVVGKYVSEGDNIGDGLDLALRVLNGFILVQQDSELSTRQLVQPESWSRRYGSGIRADSTMFY